MMRVPSGMKGGRITT